MDDMFAKLAAPLPPEAVSWRVGNTNVNKQTGAPPEGKAAQGMALAYIDARDVMERLDDVCGPAGWQNRYTHTDKKTVCEIGILVDGQWIWKADGAGESDIEAEKGALSDAFKRAAVRWGIGRYLYHLSSPWVALEPMGRSWKIKDSERAKLDALLVKDAKSAPTPKPAITGACLMACDLLKACKTPDELRGFWTINKDTLKAELPETEYALCVQTMQDEARRLKPSVLEAAG